MSIWVSFVLIGLATGSVMSRLFLPARRHDARGVVVIAAVVIACAIGGLTHLLAGAEIGWKESLVIGLTTALSIGVLAREIRARGIHSPSTVSPRRSARAPTRNRSEPHALQRPRVPGSAGRS